MDVAFNREVLLALLERLTADAKLPEPRCTSVISKLEREALAGLLGVANAQQPALSPPAIDGSAKPIPEPKYSIDLAAVAARPKDDYVVCIDFGTAKSKAFAARLNPDDDEADDIHGLELGLGKLDNDLDRAVYTVSSSLWISDEGLMYAGSDALRHSAVAHDRERLDSIKQQLIQTNHQLTLNRPLPTSINPTSVKLSYADAMCFYLAYLTDLIGKALEQSNKKLTRYTRRRFTIPAWPDSQRKWASEEVKKLLKRAQLLADTFGSRWSAGISTAEVKWVMEEAAKYDAKLDHLLDPAMNSFELGISEPMAAGSGRVRIDRSTRSLVLIVDVGAGTTDFGLFLVNHEKRTAFPVEPRSAAVRMAGDKIDSLLVEHILTKAGGYLEPGMKELIVRDLWRSGLRSRKETLFTTGTLSLRLVEGMPVTLDREEFLLTPGIASLAKVIEDDLRDFLSKVDSSFGPVAEQPTMLLTGGGADIPFITALLSKSWSIAGKKVMFKAAKRIPDAITVYDADFQREYPQLAVAMGGAMRAIDEKKSLAIFAGTTVKPGPLTKYAVTGPA
jgi:molecular chaperone HscA